MFYSETMGPNVAVNYNIQTGIIFLIVAALLKYHVFKIAIYLLDLHLDLSLNSFNFK